MLLLDDLLQVTDKDLDVLSRGGDLAVAEDLLDVGDVGASLEKVRRAGEGRACAWSTPRKPRPEYARLNLSRSLTATWTE